MDDASENATVVTGAGRPLSVKILTIYLAIFAGMAPLAVSVMIIMSSIQEPTETFFSIWSIAGSILIGIGVICSAIAAWQGKNGGRYLLVALTVLHYGLIAANNYSLLQADFLPDVSTLEPERLWARVIRGPIYIAIVVWYFIFNRRSREFYEQNNGPPRPKPI